MKLDVVSNGIVYMHLFLVALMTIAGFPPIVIYISLLWGAAATSDLSLRRAVCFGTS